jgi:type IV secretory pathway VirB2 component (pilin)
MLAVNGILAAAPGDLGNLQTALDNILRSLKNYGTTLCVIAIVISAVIWAFGAQSQNAGQATTGKRGVLIAIIAIIVIWGADALRDFAKTTGEGI